MSGHSTSDTDDNQDNNQSRFSNFSPDKVRLHTERTPISRQNKYVFSVILKLGLPYKSDIETGECGVT